jgi:class 3 adenylate cyclase/tetratricopeptide (TPR) repeat protein
VKCPACGFENPSGIKFCGNCARLLKLRCPSCGFENPPGFRFCGSCAKPLLSETSAKPSPSIRDPRSYTPKHLADKILVSRGAVEGERKQVTVLFADIERSMELAEQVDAEEWHRILDRFFAILAEGVHRFEGTINQFTGDGIMALFGAPIAHEDHARRCCYAALHLSEALRRYGEELKRTLGLGFSVRMGINSGEVVVGRIGDDLRMDYTAQGHAVGLAARMQQLAGPDRAYLTEHTAALVSGFFQLRDLGPFEVKGVRDPVRIYELEGPGPLRTRLDISRARGFSRFVGRDEEMKVVEAALANALDGAGQVVGIMGDAGVGKSRLCHELAERCHARGIRFAEGHALSHGKMIPLLPFIDFYRNFFGITEQDGDETARDKIAGRTLRLDESLAESLPIVFDFLGVPDPARLSPPMDPEARQRRLVELTQHLARARSRREPAVLLFEDLHWMDGASEAFLATMIDVLPTTRTLLVLTFRPEYRAPWMQRSYYQQLSLLPLGPRAIAELLDGLLGRDPSLAGLAERISQRAAGNPFFIEEIVQSLIEARVLAGARGARRLVKPVEKLQIPESVQSILAARIDRLGEREKSVLQIAAVIGKNFSEPILVRVAEIPEEELRAALRELVAAELVYPEDLFPVAEYAFKHPLTQEVAYRSQLAERRARTHERVARAIEEIYRDKLDERAALLAHHFEAAGERLEAAKWNRRAAGWVRSSNFAEALAHWRRVLTLLEGQPESAETVSLAIDARAAVLSYGWVLGISADEAAQLFAESTALATRSNDSRSLAILTAHYAGIKAAHREIDEYVRLSGEAVRIAEQTGDAALRAAVWPPLVRSHLLGGQLREALALCEQMLSTMPEDPQFGTFLGYSPYLNLLQLRANLLAYAGRWPEAASGFERMIAVAREHAHQALVASASSDYGWWAALLGDSQTALTQARRGLEIAEKLGSQMTRVHAYSALGLAEVSAQQWSEAVAALEQALQIANEMRTGEEAGVLTLAHLAEAHLGLGDSARARELAERSVSEACRHRVLASECFSRLVHARALLSAGGPAEKAAAATALERALALVEATGARCYEPFIRVERARLARLSGDESAGEQEMSLARRLFTEIGAGAQAETLTRLPL